MAGERKFVWFNLEKESEEYEEANSMQFSTEVKKWLSERVKRKKALQRRPSELTIDTSKLGGER
ncbi:hypothetical protein [Alicyclobacillus fastidiosus]|uniref:Uncharacterized protein n=1 Tax=Alicyclobacillus fastidiosus TaxID=392011 RepID=A0ABV5AKE3_9BACL|nr:hypothetical protein [Alicyclobacillus fastidiosus]WEH09252.1 hypothetical protein PYS47_21685 [Alicyclobacillus fastidiosus]